MDEIRIQEVSDIRIGQVEDKAAGTGCTVYAVSAGDLIADQEVVGSLAAEVISEAIINAVISAESAYGFPAARDLLVLNY